MSLTVPIGVLGLFLVVMMMMIGLWFAPTPSRATPESSLELQRSPPALEEFVEPDALEQLERLGHNRRWLRLIGFLTRLLTYAALFSLLYVWAPKDISNAPLGTLTLSDIAGVIIFVGIGIVLFRALFNPSDNDEIKDAWGWLGVVLLPAVGVGAPYLLYAAH